MYILTYTIYVVVILTKMLKCGMYVCIDEEAIEAENGQGHRADDHRIQFLSGSTYTLN